MVVKSERGRRRYVYLRVPSQMRRDDITSILDGRIPSAKVITCHAGDSVVRCLPEDVMPMVEMLKCDEPTVESVKTSGTLRTLRDAYPQLKVPQKRRR